MQILLFTIKYVLRFPIGMGGYRVWWGGQGTDTENWSGELIRWIDTECGGGGGGGRGGGGGGGNELNMLASKLKDLLLEKYSLIKLKKEWADIMLMKVSKQLIVII